MTLRSRTLFPTLWLVFGILMVGALSFCYMVEENQVPRLGMASWFLIWLLWIPMNFGITNVVAQCPISRPNWRKWIPVYLLGGVALVAAFLVCRVLLDRFFHMLNGSDFLGFRLRAFLIQSVVYDTFAFSGFVALAHASTYHDQLMGRRVKEAELEAQLAGIRLGFLKAQLQPHFLLNSLNLISAQIYEDVERADAMIADLGGLLRATLESPDQHEVPLSEELELLDLYLDIARTRFGARMEVEHEIDRNSLDALVPSLLLQPLVENAIRHGMTHPGRVSRVTISARRDPYQLLLRISDNGPGLIPDNGNGKKGAGIGLSNTRSRLEQMYGDEHRFSITNRPEGGALVTVEIPYRTAGLLPQVQPLEISIHDSHSDRRRRALSA